MTAWLAPAYPWLLAIVATLAVGWLALAALDRLETWAIARLRKRWHDKGTDRHGDD